MDGLQKKFLNILKKALRGEKAAGCEDLSAGQWQQLFSMAQTHSVLPLFYEAVYDALTLQEEHGAMAAAIRQQVRHQVMIQTLRTQEFLELNGKLRQAGIKPLVVKGIICRNLYPKPDHRQSSDEDVLIPEEQFALCHRVMTEFGMETQLAETASSYEVPYRKAGSPLYIELHKHLFPPESEAYGDLNRFFEGVFDRAVAEKINGETVYSMEYTDHLFYLICHAFKHFLHSGFGIRQVCDIILYANAYGEKIDWNRVLKNCTAIRAEVFAAALFRIGEKYLVFSPARACYPAKWRRIPVDETDMLEDLLSGGLYGSANMSRKHSSNITLDAVAAQKQGRRARSTMVTSVFPPAEKLEGRFPYLKKHPWLVPVAWGQRLWSYGLETRSTRDNTAADAMKIGARRVELLREYGILD